MASVPQRLISISPTRLRPHSATSKTSQFAKKAPSPHSARAASGLVSSVKSAASAPSSPDALTLNLKQQIACLEMEVRYLKQQPSPSNISGKVATAPAATSRSNTHLNNSIDSGRQQQQQHGAAGDFFRRAEELESEVVMLRNAYAEREQAHSIEVAALKQELSHGNQSQRMAASIREEVDRREAQHKQEVKAHRSLHAQEVVLLQKTVERLQLENQNSESYIKNLLAEKDDIIRETITLKDTLRATLGSLESETRQKQEAMAQLNCEQERRRASELKEADLQLQLNGLTKGLLVELEAKVAEAERSRRTMQAELQSKLYELEHAKITIEKQTKDVGTAAAERMDATTKDIVVKEQIAQLEVKLAKAAVGLTDIQAEKEYYRLQTDRLKVESAVLEVRCKQAEQQLNAERASLVSLEKQYCTSLEQAELLRREAKSKEDVYRGMDRHHTDVRMQQRVLQEENEDLHLKQKETRLELDALRREYDGIKHFAEAAKRDGQIQNALVKLTKTKEEIQALLSAQARLSSDINDAMCELPDSSTLSRIVTPPRRHESPTRVPRQQEHRVATSSVTVDVSAATSAAAPVEGAVVSSIVASAVANAVALREQMDAVLRGIDDQEAMLPGLMSRNTTAL